jgi:mono/diheme cytochrome c family protein
MLRLRLGRTGNLSTSYLQGGRFDRYGAVAWFVMLVLGSALAIAQDPASVPPPKNLVQVREQIKIAREEFKSENFDACEGRIKACLEVLEELILASDRKELPEWERVHRQLNDAAVALAIQGAEFEPIPEWKAIREKIRDGSKARNASAVADSTTPSSNQVRFTTQIAPILVEHCGKCHIDKSRGEFTLATYQELMKGSKAGVVLFPGDPASSPLVSVIESGQMPPSGNRVPADQLLLIKSWVTQGAKYDASDPTLAIKTLVEKERVPAVMDKPAFGNAGNGSNTVRFSGDIAPLFVAHCNGCHFEANNVRGGLRMNSFNDIAKGGDSGPMIEPRQGDASLLVKKLLGTSGQRMPAGGRPPLSESQIGLVRKWIDEGASFDGENRDARLDAVIAKGFASRASHEELLNRRIDRARAKWQIVSPKSQPDEALDAEFHILGNIGNANAKKLLEQVQLVSKNLKRSWKISSKDPFVKGGITLFAVKSRYDYSELGKMLERRVLPAEWSAHWRSEVPDLYIAMVYDASDSKLNESILVHQLTSTWFASQNGVPRWFAEGAGRAALANAVGMNDPRVQTWVRRYPTVIGELKNIQPIIQGKMNDEDEAVLGFGLVRQMQSGPLKRKLDLTIKQLDTEQDFQILFQSQFGPMEMFLKQSLGKP